MIADSCLTSLVVGSKLDEMRCASTFAVSMHARFWRACAYAIAVLVLGMCCAPLRATAWQEQKAAVLSPELQQAVAMAQAGHLAEAEQAFSQIVAAHPGDPRALTGLGQVQVQEGKVQEGIKAFQRVVVIDPQSSEAHVNLGIALASRAEFAAALAESSTACRLAPNSPESHFLRARLLADLGRRDQARVEFERTLELAPRGAAGLMQWAELEGDDGHLGKQASLLQRYVALVPSDANAWFRLGQCLQAQGRRPDAAFRHALELNPQHAEAMYALGRALSERDPEESRKLLHQVAALHDLQRVRDRIYLLGNQANQEVTEGKFDRAADELNEAIQICGDCSLAGDLHKNLGLAYCRSGHLSAGQRELKIAAGLKPQDEDIGRAIAVSTQQQTASGDP